jgi:hypothetical protein
LLAPAPRTWEHEYWMIGQNPSGADCWKALSRRFLCPGSHATWRDGSYSPTPPSSLSAAEKSRTGDSSTLLTKFPEAHVPRKWGFFDCTVLMYCFVSDTAAARAESANILELHVSVSSSVPAS